MTPPDEIKALMADVLDQMQAKYPVGCRASEAEDEGESYWDLHVWPALVVDADGTESYEPEVVYRLDTILPAFDRVEDAVLINGDVYIRGHKGPWAVDLTLRRTPPNNVRPMWRIDADGNAEYLGGRARGASALN